MAMIKASKQKKIWAFPSFLTQFPLNIIFQWLSRTWKLFLSSGNEFFWISLEIHFSYALLENRDCGEGLRVGGRGWAWGLGESLRVETPDQRLLRHDCHSRSTRKISGSRLSNFEKLNSGFISFQSRKVWMQCRDKAEKIVLSYFAAHSPAQPLTATSALDLLLSQWKLLNLQFDAAEIFPTEFYLKPEPNRIETFRLERNFANLLKVTMDGSMVQF